MGHGVGIRWHFSDLLEEDRSILHPCYGSAAPARVVGVSVDGEQDVMNALPSVNSRTSRLAFLEVDRKQKT